MTASTRDRGLLGEETGRAAGGGTPPALLMSIVESSDDAITTKTLEGIVTSWNPAAERMYGYSAAEIVGTPFAILIPRDRPDDLVRILKEIRDGHRVEHYETFRVRKDGSTFPVSLTVSPIHDARGRIIGASSIARDITEHVRAEEALRQAKAAAEEANRELEAFSYSVAHDLRAPLRSIDGFSLALLEDCADRLDDDGKRYLRYVRESAQKMGALIDDLLNLSRVSRAGLRRERVDLSALARTVAARLRETEPDREVEVVVEEGLVAEADPRLLDIVLTNLLGNAWKFTGGRAHARIEFAAGAGAQPPEYLVRDNGAGFDPEYAGRLFGVFQRLHTDREFEGTGIGLATVQRIVHRHGGRIRAEGAVDRGATFRFTLEGVRT